MDEQNLMQHLDATYLERCSDPSLRRGAWDDLAVAFPPGYTNDRPVPFLITRQAGDLGLAMLWIVQTAVIRPMLARLLSMPDLPGHSRDIIKSSGVTAIGAMAHTDKADDPMTFRVQGNDLLLTGTKNYITGGEDASILLMTVRDEGGEKPSGLVIMTAREIPAGALVTMPRRNLLTVHHGVLTLREHPMDRASLLPLNAGGLRRKLAASPQLERALVLEAWMGLLLYMLEKTGTGQDLAKELEAQAEAARQHYMTQKEMLEGEGRVTPFIPDIDLMHRGADLVLEGCIHDERKELTVRLEDLKFLLSMLPGKR